LTIQIAGYLNINPDSMITDSIKKILKAIRSEKVLNKIASGRIVYFENRAEGIAFKCVHIETGKPSKYYAKHFGRDEFEIDFDSGPVIMAVLEGNPISKAKYDKYHLISGNFWNRNINITSRKREWAISS
jgi:hypothetical protein